MRYLSIPLTVILLSGCTAALPNATEPSSSPVEATASPVSPETPPAFDPFREAVNKATTAAQLAQSAETATEWQGVAVFWSEAARLMRLVPQSSSNYAIAQQKAAEYQKNLSSAQSNEKKAGASTAAQPPAATAPQPSNIGKTDTNGVVITVDVPGDEPCLRSYVSVKKDTFDQCLVPGLSYVQVANVLGNRGELQAQSANTEIWQWNDGAGKYLSATFVSGRLVSKSQVGLELH